VVRILPSLCDVVSGRRLPVGAELVANGVSFRVWAPDRRRVECVVEGAPSPVGLAAETGGYFAGEVEGIGAGALYRFLLDGADGPFPDPASRFQPQGPEGPSQVVDPAR
jgi:maltooligosyltrehalose trehalohydrolase